MRMKFGVYNKTTEILVEPGSGVIEPTGELVDTCVYYDPLDHDLPLDNWFADKGLFSLTKIVERVLWVCVLALVCVVGFNVGLLIVYLAKIVGKAIGL